jgi:glycine cleavage system H protein
MKHKEYELPDDLRYHNEHCWARQEGPDTLVIGWTDFAQKLAAELTSVQVPEEGEPIMKDKFMGTIESGKWVGRLFAPVDGEVVILNEDIMDDPRIINEDPYGRGWIMKVKMKDPSQLGDLLEPGAYVGVIDSKLKELNM